MSAQEVIAEFKALPPNERAQVVHYVVENEEPVTAGKAVSGVAEDGLPILRADGVITSRLVRELESLTS